MEKLLDVISRETTDIEKEAAIAAHAHFLSGRQWARVHVVLGIPSTILAASAGVSAFADQAPLLTGGIAMTVAALSALNTFLSSGDRASAHRSSNATFNNIRRKASLLRDLDAHLIKEGDEEAAKNLATHLRALVAEMTKADQRAPRISGSSKTKAELKLNEQRSTVSLNA